MVRGRKRKRKKKKKKDYILGPSLLSNGHPNLVKQTSFSCYPLLSFVTSILFHCLYSRPNPQFRRAARAIGVTVGRTLLVNFGNTYPEAAGAPDPAVTVT